MRRGAMIIGAVSAGLLGLELLGWFVIGCERGPMPQLPEPIQIEEVWL